MGSEREETSGVILIFTPNCGNMFFKHLLDHLWSGDKEGQAIEVSVLCSFSAINQPLPLWHMLAEQFTSAQMLCADQSSL